MRVIRDVKLYEAAICVNELIQGGENNMWEEIQSVDRPIENMIILVMSLTVEENRQ